MSDEKKTYTVDEVRKAFRVGAEYQHNVSRSLFLDETAIQRLARHLYPSPKKLREVKIGSSVYRIRDGVVEFRDCGMWSPSINMSVQMFQQWRDLIDNPYEDDES